MSFPTTRLHPVEIKLHRTALVPRYLVRRAPPFRIKFYSKRFFFFLLWILAYGYTFTP